MVAVRGGDDITRGPVVVVVAVRVRNISVVPRSVTRFVAFLVRLLFFFSYFSLSLTLSIPDPLLSRRHRGRNVSSCPFGYRRRRPARSSLYTRTRVYCAVVVFPKRKFFAGPVLIFQTEVTFFFTSRQKKKK